MQRLHAVLLAFRFIRFGCVLGFPSAVRWVYDDPGCFVDCDGDTDVSEQGDCDIAEECEIASEADLAHLFGYNGDYGNNGFLYSIGGDCCEKNRICLL